MDKRLKNFKNFLYLCWKHLNLPNPTPIQFDIADYLQSNEKRLVIEAFRGVGKSWITSAFVCHQLLLNPQKNILVVSASKTRADDFSTFTQRLIGEMPLLQHLIPRDNQRHSKVSFDVAPATASHAPSVKSMGITGQLTGSRADIIIADDVESANNSQTQLMRDRLGETVKEFDAIIKPNTGRIIFLGTPQNEMSLYNSLEERGFKTKIWTALVPNPTQKISYGHKLADIIQGKEGEPTDPKRFDAVDLMERLSSYGRSGFNLQFMLDTSLSDANRYPLKLNDLIVASGCSTWKDAPAKIQWASSPEQMKAIDPDIPNVGLKGDYFVAPMMMSEEFTAFEGTVMSIDPSGRGEDKTAYAVLKMLHGVLYLTAIGSLDGGYSETTMARLSNIAKKHDVNYVVIESNFGDGMFSSLLKPILSKIYPVSINPDEVRHNTQKEMRIIDSLEVIMNSHRLVVDKSLVIKDGRGENKNHQLFYQMTRLTRQRGALLHDDAIDALAIACKYWTEALERDSDTALDDYREEWRENELKKFMESAGQLGSSETSDSWV